MLKISNIVKQHEKELQAILDCIKVGIYIADGRGKTLILNGESEKTGGRSKKQLVGKYMKDLIKEGYVEESSILKALDSGKEESIIQKLGDGDEIYITGVPYYTDGKIDCIICTERDITETISLKQLLKEKEAINEKYESELEYLRKKSIMDVGEIVTCCKVMTNVMENAFRVATLDTTVLVTGESGTGKELMASLIYKNSHRINMPFIKINCAAIPENLLESEFFGYEKGSFTGADKQGKVGLFELASGGTLFLDEIAELTLPMQSKILRVLQEKEIMRVGGSKPIPIDVRIIAATNVGLKKAVEDGRFREDLFYRLNIIPLEIPPLRERKDDIELIGSHFLSNFNKSYNLQKVINRDAFNVMKNYKWPGNVRELRNFIERIVLSGEKDIIDEKDVIKLIQSNEKNPFIEEDLLEPKSLDERIAIYEKKILTELMKSCNSAAEVSRLLEVNKSTICRKLKKYGIENKAKLNVRN